MAKINLRNALPIASAATALVLVAALSGTFMGPADAQVKGGLSSTINEYAVKFLCGRVEPDEKKGAPLLRGSYATAVNVHNPGAEMTFERKVAFAPLNEPGPVTDYRRTTLGYDQAIEFACSDVFDQAKLQEPGFVTGFLVIHAVRELDVVAVYTAGDGSVTSVHTERVPLRRVSAFPPPPPKGGKGPAKGK